MDGVSEPSQSLTTLRVGRYVTGWGIRSTRVDPACSTSVAVIARNAGALVALIAHAASWVVGASLELHTPDTPGDAVGQCGCCHQNFVIMIRAVGSGAMEGEPFRWNVARWVVALDTPPKKDQGLLESLSHAFGILVHSKVREVMCSSTATRSGWGCSVCPQ